MADEKPICGATTRGERGGRPCRNPAGFRTHHLGEGRCFLHGGASDGPPKGNTNALSHGVYSDALKDDERDIWSRIELGSIDDELRIARLQLRRAVKADKDEMANRLLGRIAQLETVRQTLAERGGRGQAHEAAIEDLD